MLRWEDVYKVVVSMVPLYVPLALGYLSVKRWHMFKSDQCDAINRFNCYFIIPFFTFHFTASIDPYRMNYRFMAGDVVAKAIVGLVLALWANFGRKGNFSWAVTSFSMSCMNNTLVVGVPLLEAMYGPLGRDLVVQSSVIQSLIWCPLLLFLLELWRSTNNNSSCESGHEQQQVKTDHHVEIVVAQRGGDDNTTEDHHVENEDESTMKSTTMTMPSSSHMSLGSTMKKVGAKLARNPNCYACALGVIWSLLAKRWNLEMPSIVEGSIFIMAKAGSGVAMFSMGLFMALQKKVIACGVQLAVYGMILRFVTGPLTTAIGALALGLRSDVLRIVIMQAALPQAIVSFVFAQEYGLHANVLSTAVIFGTIVSLPLLIGYYVALGAIHYT